MVWDALGGSRVYISGHLNITENGTFIEQAGTDKRLCVNLDPSYDVSEIIDEGENRSTETHTFIGRLYQKNAAEDGAIQMCLDSTSPDLDQDLLSYEDELNYGTNSSNSDSDGDGIDDGQEVSDGTNPLSIVSESNISIQESNNNQIITNIENNPDNTPEDFANTESEGIDLVNILIWIIVFLIVSVILISSVSYINIKKKANMLMEEE